MGGGRRYGLLAIVVYLCVYLLPLGGRPLFVPDESRYGEIAREMVASGDWTVPRLDGLRYFEKPVLGYWAHAAAITVLGRNRFALRLPSAMAVGGAALVVFLLLRLVSAGRDDDPLPALGALVFLTCFEVVAVGTFTVLDSLLAFFLTATMAALFMASEARPASARERLLLLAAGGFCGLAFLTKGFLALAVPVAVFMPYLLWSGRGRDILRLPWLPLGGAALVALPWSLAIAAREPDFWHYFFWIEHVRRFFADNAQHGEPFWYYAAAAPALFLPWSFVVPAVWGGLGRGPGPDGAEGAEGRLRRFALCWLVMPFIFFSVAHGKLLTYILPCFPPFALLAALGLRRGGERERRRFARGARLLGGLFFLFALALLVAQSGVVHGFRLYDRTWKWLMALNTLALFVFFAVSAGRRPRLREAAGRMALAPVAFMIAIQFILPDLTVEKKSPEALLLRHRRDIAPETLVVAGEQALTMACFVFGRDDVFLLGNPGELAYGLGYPDAAGRRLDPGRAAALVAANPGRVVLVARARNYRRWRASLPSPRVLDDNGPQGYVFVRF